MSALEDELANIALDVSIVRVCMNLIHILMIAFINFILRSTPLVNSA